MTAEPCQFVPQGGNFADNHQCGTRGLFRYIRQIFQTACPYRLIEQRAVGDDGDRRVFAASVADKLGGNFNRFECSHINDPRLAAQSQRVPVGFAAVVSAVAGNEQRALSTISVGQRNPRIGCRAQCGDYARYDSASYFVLPLYLRAVTAASENKGIAAFKPYDASAFPRVTHQQAVGFFLLDMVRAGPFANADFFSILAYDRHNFV